MKRVLAQRYVPVWQTKVIPKKDQSLTSLNREIRDWLGENIGSGSWETKLQGNYVEITFDIDAEDDAMAFKLTWVV